MYSTYIIIIIIIYSGYPLHRSVFQWGPAKIMYNTVTIQCDTISFFQCIVSRIVSHINIPYTSYLYSLCFCLPVCLCFRPCVCLLSFLPSFLPPILPPSLLFLPFSLPPSPVCRFSYRCTCRWRHNVVKLPEDIAFYCNNPLRSQTSASFGRVLRWTRNHFL